MLVEIDTDDDLHSAKEKRWFMENVLLDKEGLLLYSNEIGDTVGLVNVLDVYPF